jgi:hypothetical protein
MTNETMTRDKIDLQEAENNLKQFLSLQTQKAAIDTNMKAYKEALKDFADRNKSLIDGKGNLNLISGYLHFGKKTVVKFPKRFNLLKFVQKFPALIKWEFRTQSVREHFQNEKTQKQMHAFKLKLTDEPTFDIIAKVKE